MDSVMQTEIEIVRFQIEAMQKELNVLIKKLQKLREPFEVESFELIDCGQG